MSLQAGRLSENMYDSLGIEEDKVTGLVYGRKDREHRKGENISHRGGYKPVISAASYT